VKEIRNKTQLLLGGVGDGGGCGVVRHMNCTMQKMADMKGRSVGGMISGTALEREEREYFTGAGQPVDDLVDSKRQMMLATKSGGGEKSKAVWDRGWVKLRGVNNIGGEKWKKRDQTFYVGNGACTSD